MEELFGRQRLLQSGLAVAAGQKRELNPILFDVMPNPILPLRMLPNYPPFNLLTNSGSVTGQLPVLAAASDYRVQNAVLNTNMLFLTANLEDTSRLRAIGMPVAPAFGLEHLTSETLHDFRTALGLIPASPQFSLVQWLVLVGWTPSRGSLQCPRIIQEVAQSLEEVAGCLGLPQQNVLLWQPTVGDLSKLRHCLNLGRKQDVVDAINSSILSSCKPLSGPTVGEHLEHELLTAERKVRAVLRDPEAGPRRRKRPLQRQQRIFEKALVRPILKLADQTEDPNERTRLYALAQAARTLSLTSTLHQAKLENEIINQGLGGDGTSHDISGLMKSLETVIKLCKETD